MMIRIAQLKPSMITIYIWCELIVWSFMTYSAIYHGKMFDHDHVKTEEFVSHIEGNKGGNWYYRLMFGNLNLQQIDADQQRNIQVKCDALNTLFVFVFGAYFILTIFFLFGMSEMLRTKCLLCPYVTFDLSVMTSVVVFTVYGSFMRIDVLSRNGSFFTLVKLVPSATIFSYFQSLKE